VKTTLSYEPMLEHIGPGRLRRGKQARKEKRAAPAKKKKVHRIDVWHDVPDARMMQQTQPFTLAELAQQAASADGAQPARGAGALPVASQAAGSATVEMATSWWCAAARCQRLAME